MPATASRSRRSSSDGTSGMEGASMAAMAARTLPRRRRGGRPSQLALVDVHDRPVRRTLAVGEPELLVERAGRDVVLARAELDAVRAARAGVLQGRLQQRAAQPVP